MKKFNHIAYFEHGTIIETSNGKSHFKRIIREERYFTFLETGKYPRVWFRPCEAWKNAVNNFKY